MSLLISFIDQKFYPAYEANWDDKLLRSRILSLLDKDKSVLDLGAGAGIVSEMDFRGFAKRVCGVDLDPRVVSNPLVDEGRVADASKIPYGENLFDLVFADNVVEHLDDPAAVFSEVRRVLKPGGIFIFKTPNRSHYMPLIARYTPHRFHQFVNRIRGRAEVDTFPTRYRANGATAIIDLSKSIRFDVRGLERIEGRPEYLRMFAFSYIFGLVYEKIVNSHAIFSRFRILIIATLQKPCD